MSEPSQAGTAFKVSVGLALVGGYADAATFLLAGTFSGHLTGNSVLAAVSAASNDWHLTFARLLAVLVFVIGVILSQVLNRFLPSRLRSSSLAIAMAIEVLLFLSAYSLLASQANQEWFIVCMCLALGIQNGALTKTKGIGVHSTYMTGLVTTLTQMSFAYFIPQQRHQPAPAKDSAGLNIKVLAPMYLSFVVGAFAGAVMVAILHPLGVLGIILPLLILIFLETTQRRNGTP